MSELPRVPAVIEPPQPPGGDDSRDKTGNADDGGGVHAQMVALAPDKVSACFSVSSVPRFPSAAGTGPGSAAAARRCRQSHASMMLPIPDIEIESERELVMRQSLCELAECVEEALAWHERPMLRKRVRRLFGAVLRP